MLNTLKKLSVNIQDNISVYDYKKGKSIDYNNLNFILNNDLNYVFIIDYNNQQINIDIYNNNKKIMYNICYDLYYNKAAFNLFIDAILNKDNNLNYRIIKINKYAVTF